LSSRGNHRETAHVEVNKARKTRNRLLVMMAATVGVGMVSVAISVCIGVNFLGDPSSYESQAYAVQPSSSSVMSWRWLGYVFVIGYFLFYAWTPLFS